MCISTIDLYVGELRIKSMASIPSEKLHYIEQLYYKEHKSAREIAGILDVSLDAVYYFMRHYNLKRRSLSEENSLRFANKQLSFDVKQKLNSSEKELKLVGLMLYWCEGYKTDLCKVVDFANSDPSMIQIFLRFLREICGVDESKLRVYLYCYSNQNVDGLKQYWSSVMKIPLSQFTKPYVREDFKLDKIGKMPHGMVHVRYGDKKLFLLIKQCIQEYIDYNCVGGGAV